MRCYWNPRTVLFSLFFYFFMWVRLHPFSKQRSRSGRQVLMAYSWTGGLENQRSQNEEEERRGGEADVVRRQWMGGWMNGGEEIGTGERKEGEDGRKGGASEAGWAPLIIYDGLGFLSRPSSRAPCLPLTFNLSENQRAWSLIIVSVCRRRRRQTLR